LTGGSIEGRWVVWADGAVLGRWCKRPTVAVAVCFVEEMLEDALAAALDGFHSHSGEPFPSRSFLVEPMVPYGDR
jgi:hypothetical protein